MLKEEVDRTLTSFNPVFIPATKNNVSVDSDHQSTNFNIFIEDK